MVEEAPPPVSILDRRQSIDAEMGVPGLGIGGQCEVVFVSVIIFSGIVSTFYYMVILFFSVGNYLKIESTFWVQNIQEYNFTARLSF